MAIKRDKPVCPECKKIDNVSIAYGLWEGEWTDIWWCHPRTGCGIDIKEVEGTLH